MKLFHELNNQQVIKSLSLWYTNAQRQGFGMFLQKLPNFPHNQLKIWLISWISDPFYFVHERWKKMNFLHGKFKTPCSGKKKQDFKKESIWFLFIIRWENKKEKGKGKWRNTRSTVSFLTSSRLMIALSPPMFHSIERTDHHKSPITEQIFIRLKT